VKKKLLHINIGLILAVLFAACYQSVHAFSHEHHLKTECCDDSHHLTFKSSEKTITESDDCPICDFKFAAFVTPEILGFDLIPSFYEIPYQFNSTESCIVFEGTSFYLRGPPVFIS
jgi:hypothetical protein